MKKKLKIKSNFQKSLTLNDKELMALKGGNINGDTLEQPTQITLCACGPDTLGGDTLGGDTFGADTF